MSILGRATARVPEARALLEARVAQGKTTYGTTLDENQAPLETRLQHALEEALDLLQYLEWALEKAPEPGRAQLQMLAGLAALTVRGLLHPGERPLLCGVNVFNEAYEVSTHVLDLSQEEAARLEGFDDLMNRLRHRLVEVIN
ncbi:hypothetical protein [Meiothermus ruber]|uniref:Uncharacterized protein n=1 Tax=Meiothermus ruber (strain ATCC 35948 / DSM 1279 / VKM B-1258 / 21) TaxID=504728 RepID=D3PNF6_MEIRD|nr:hypothetical protein [Meiothermus ruber]ADD27347.1 hypothetical protein Mrub_0574 [Meiothermus ruber DSM 1279]AGK03804.1 hypothetical protein K649_02510 [Meiothermus ruber DSM 1279]